MEKVKVTQEQADAIEKIKKYETTPAKYANVKTQLEKNWRSHPYENLNKLEIYEFLDALYIGYEVEPEYKAWDWITYDKDKYGNRNKQIVQIEEIKYSNYWEERCACWDGGNSSLPLSEIKHATSEEIAEEKERIFFARHGRESWELKIGDILINLDTGFPAVVTNDQTNNGNLNLNGVFYHKQTIKDNYRVASFVDGRLDVKQ